MNPDAEQIQHSLAWFPSANFLMTASHDGKRACMRVRSVQPCSDDPPLLAVAVQKGHRIDPLIRDSHAFAICLIGDDDQLLLRKFPFVEPQPIVENDVPVLVADPFDAIAIEHIRTGSPVIARAAASWDCEVVRHFDLEANHEIYVGLVVGVSVNGERSS